MRLNNLTNHRIPKQWLERILDHLGVNPLITIEYSDNPDEVKHPNFRHIVDGKEVSVDGIANHKNEVYVYVGRWKEGKFDDYTLRFVKHIIAHEVRHQYYYYYTDGTKGGCADLDYDEKLRREERACSRFANLVVGTPDKDFKRIKKTRTKVSG